MGTRRPDWGVVQPEIAQSTRVCAYDRAGMGWSERGSAPRDVNQHVRELHALLTRAGIEGPYVMVGHSYGGRIARGLRQGVCGQVVGMVLIDPGTFWMTITFSTGEAYRTRDAWSHWRWLAPFGAVRLLLPQGDFGDLPPMSSSHGHVRGVDEMLSSHS